MHSIYQNVEFFIENKNGILNVMTFECSLVGKEALPAPVIPHWIGLDRETILH